MRLFPHSAQKMRRGPKTKLHILWVNVWPYL